MNEIIFIVEESPEGGYLANAVNYSIYTDGDTIEAVRENVKDAVQCHFDVKDLPKLIKLLKYLRLS